MNTKKVKCICVVHRSAAANYLSKIAVEMARSRRFYRYFIGNASKSNADRCYLHNMSALEFHVQGQHLPGMLGDAV